MMFGGKRNLWVAQTLGVSTVLCLVAVVGLHRASAQATGPLKLGVLTDMSSLYADNGGQGTVVAAQMAIDDFGGGGLCREKAGKGGGHPNRARRRGGGVRRLRRHENGGG